MSITSIPGAVQIRLWQRAAGRCQYEGCNQPLWRDDLTLRAMNKSYIAHIIADSPDGPRGDVVQSDKLKADISNLMLMCDAHHRLIDIVDVAGHPVERLVAMKTRHEQRIELLTSIQEDKRSLVVLYGANIGENNPQLSWQIAAHAMTPHYYPAEGIPIQMSLQNSSLFDHESAYWEIERQQLQRQFQEKIRGRLQQGNAPHLSIFSLAPQPMLMELGRLLSDIPAAEVYQLHREPPDWKWQKHEFDLDLIVKEPSDIRETVALNLSLSATITSDRIYSVLGDDISLWELTIVQPNNDFLKSREQLSEFRRVFRALLDRIKAKHGQNTILHIFPAVPVSVAVEVGRVWMPKADMNLRLYDQNSKRDGFRHVFDICYGG